MSKSVYAQGRGHDKRGIGVRGLVAREHSDDGAKTRRREQILSVATAVFAESGYQGASISDIIERAGIARGTFYLYFSSKHSVLEAILGSALTRLTARIERVDLAPEAPSPSEQLRNNLIRVLRFVTEERKLTQLLLNHGLSPTDEVAEWVSTFYEQTTSLIEKSLQHGIDLGFVRPCNVPVAAAAMLGAITGVVAHLIAKGGAKVDLDQAAEEILTFALRGVMLGEASLRS